MKKVSIRVGIALAACLTAPLAPSVHAEYLRVAGDESNYPERAYSLNTIVQTRFHQDVATNKDALSFLLDSSGYQLADATPDMPMYEMLVQPLDESNRAIGPTTLHQALGQIGGDDYQMVVDLKAREVAFNQKAVTPVTRTVEHKQKVADLWSDRTVRNLDEMVLAYDSTQLEDYQVIQSKHPQPAAKLNAKPMPAIAHDDNVEGHPMVVHEHSVTVMEPEEEGIPNYKGAFEGSRQGYVELDQNTVMNEVVKVRYEEASLAEILEAIKPEGWKVTIDTTREEIKHGRWNFYTTTYRRQALADLLYPMDLDYRLFFELLDDEGHPAPELLISDRVYRGGNY